MLWNLIARRPFNLQRESIFSIRGRELDTETSS